MTGRDTRVGTSRITPLHILVVGQIFIGTASWAALIAVQTEATYELHQKALFMAAVTMAWGAPTILLSPLVGRVIDSRGPRVVGIVSTLVSALAMTGLIFTTGPATLWVMTFISGIARAFAQPAADSMPSWLPGPAEHVKSSVWLGFAASVPMIAGPGLAAILVAAWGTTSAFIATAVAFLLGGSVFVLLRLARVPGQTESAETGQGPKGMRGLLAHPGLRFTILLTLIVWISYGSLAPLEILYIKDVLGEPVATFATIEMVYGTGLLAATLFIARFDALLTSRHVLPVSVLLVGGGQVLYSATHSLTIAYIGVGLWGVANGVFNPACRVTLLTRTPVEQHGRAMALWRAVQSFGSLAPPTAAGAVAHFAGVQPTIIAVGGLVAITGVVACAMNRAGAAAEDVVAEQGPLLKEARPTL
ncbi:MFS transporter [Streptomyces sp. NPDC014894]|uniref:MFS transporter n=1 Tax=Streptomyces sp. NPDC014894 TaxID=3364931 RepID=UPI0036FD30E0